MDHPPNKQKADRLSELPVGILQDILLKLDIPELMPLKGVTKMYRALIESELFIKAYNGRECSGWSIVHVVDYDSPVIGALVLIRDSDTKIVVRSLGDILEGIADEEGDLSLLAACDSLVLLKYLPMEKNSPMQLLVINLSNNQVHPTNVPQPLGFNMHFNHREHVQFTIDNQRGPLIGYKINYVGYGEDLEPRYCKFQSVNGNYRWAIQPVRRLEQHENLNPFDPQTGMIHMIPQFTFLVSMRLNEPVYKNPAVDAQDLYNRPPAFDPDHADFAPEFLEPEEGWEPIISHHYGKDGWGVMMLRHRVPLDIGLTRLHILRLFKLTSDWSVYKHVSSSKPNPMSGDLFNITCNVHVEQTGTTVHVAFITTSEVDNEGNRLVHFAYEVPSDDWKLMVTTVAGVTAARKPVFTSRLTLGNIQVKQISRQ